MADESKTDRTEEGNADKNVAPRVSMMVVNVKTPMGKEEITISEDSSVLQVRSRTLFNIRQRKSHHRHQAFPSTMRGKLKRFIVSLDVQQRVASLKVFSWCHRCQLSEKCLPDAEPAFKSDISKDSRHLCG